MNLEEKIWKNSGELILIINVVEWSTLVEPNDDVCSYGVI